MNKEISSVDLAWIAGFLEGEGSFYTCGVSPCVVAVQVQQWPILKLHELLGGGTNTFERKIVKGGIYHRWDLYGMRAIEVMLSIYHLMSPWRKEQIFKTLSCWHEKPNRNNQGKFSLEEKSLLKNRVSEFFVNQTIKEI